MTQESYGPHIFASRVMIKDFRIVTITHKQLNTEDLEHFIVKYDERSELSSKLHAIKDRFGQDELLYLATCNRVIFFFYGEQEFNKNHSQDLLYFINPTLSKTDHHSIDQLVEFHVGIEAIRHIYEVCSSIDSLVVGEREIFRQFRQAYDFCRNHALCGDHMRLVEKSVVKAAKDVYTNTAIGAKPVSVVSLAIQEFLRKKIDTSSRILMIGAGETNTTVGRFLKKYGYSNIVIFNRTFDNALKLSKELGAQAMHMRELSSYKGGFDCIFTCTASQEPIINSQTYQLINQDASHKVIVDLSIPHNVSKDVAQLDTVSYISVDTVRQLAEENMRKRSGNIAAARIILNSHLDEFKNLWHRRQVERTFGQLPKEIKKVKERALSKVYKEAIADLPMETQSLIYEIADYMEKKCVAVPMKMAKSSETV